MAKKRAQEEAKKKGVKLKRGFESKQKKESGKSVEKQLEERQTRLMNNLKILQNDIAQFADSLQIPISVLEQIDPNLLEANENNHAILMKGFNETEAKLLSLAEKMGMSSAEVIEARKRSFNV